MRYIYTIFLYSFLMKDVAEFDPDVTCKRSSNNY
jgi:hypothetical protein